MAWQLPPLPAVRVFEAAARLGNFTRAAEELGMTQAAVSYQIKLLEERVGAPLFIRQARRVILTDVGTALASQATQAFALLAEAYQTARGGAAGRLSISTMQTFAFNWLGPANSHAHPTRRWAASMSSFVRSTIRLDVSRLTAMFIGIRVGAGEWP